MRRATALFLLALASPTLASPTLASPALSQEGASLALSGGDPVPTELRTLAYDMVGGATGSFKPSFSDPAFSATDEDGELVDIFDFGSTAPAFATGPGGRRSFELGFSHDTTAVARALNFGRLTFGTLTTEVTSGPNFGPNSFEETAAVENGLTAFVNYDFVNDRQKRFGFDVHVAQRGFSVNGFDTQQDVSSEVGASFSADVRLSSRLSFTGRAGINLSEDATRAHFDATANKGVTKVGALSLLEEETGLKDAYVEGGFSFALTENFEVKATLGYARELDTTDDALRGRIGAAYKLRF